MLPFPNIATILTREVVGDHSDSSPFLGRPLLPPPQFLSEKVAESVVGFVVFKHLYSMRML